MKEDGWMWQGDRGRWIENNTVGVNVGGWLDEWMRGSRYVDR